jgi:hypothetical protein
VNLILNSHTNELTEIVSFVSLANISFNYSSTKRDLNHYNKKYVSNSFIDYRKSYADQKRISCHFESIICICFKLYLRLFPNLCCYMQRRLNNNDYSI